MAMLPCKPQGTEYREPAKGIPAMNLGMSTAAFTLFHVILSLIGLATGGIVAFGLRSAKALPGWTMLFLITTVATSATGFLFHSVAFGPPHIIGVISLIVLAVAIFALYVRQLAAAWRWIYVTAALFAFYLNVFVGVVQAFQKIPVLHQLAPNGSEPPFAVAQLLVLALFIWLGVVSVKRFHPSFGAASA
jgi:hypothetical protein